jgi:hypothetical protein
MKPLDDLLSMAVWKLAPCFPLGTGHCHSYMHARPLFLQEDGESLASVQKRPMATTLIR